MKDSSYPSHKVVIPYQQILELAPIAEEMAKQDYKQVNDDDLAFHLAMWPADSDGRSVLENSGRQIRVYEDADTKQRDPRREEPIETLS